MKKIALALLLTVAVALIASAQESDLYVKTLYIEKVYPHQLGYRIDYRLTTSMFMATSYIPIDWFGRSDSPARLIYSTDKAVPFANVYWDGGEFSHVVLVVHPSYDHISWGQIEDSDALRARFERGDPAFQF